MPASLAVSWFFSKQLFSDHFSSFGDLAKSPKTVRTKDLGPQHFLYDQAPVGVDQGVLQGRWA
jgi:hypothetical protein